MSNPYAWHVPNASDTLGKIMEISDDSHLVHIAHLYYEDDMNECEPSLDNLGDQITVGLYEWLKERLDYHLRVWGKGYVSAGGMGSDVKPHIQVERERWNIQLILQLDTGLVNGEAIVREEYKDSIRFRKFMRDGSSKDMFVQTCDFELANPTCFQDVYEWVNSKEFK